MKNILTGTLAGILSLFSIILFIITIWSLTLSLPLPAIDLNNDGFNFYLQYLRFPIISSAAFLYAVTLLIAVIRIQQANNSLKLLREEIYSAERPRLFLTSSKIYFDTIPSLGKLFFKFNGEPVSAIKIINGGKEPALEVRIKYIFDYSGSIKLIKANDLFHLFTFNEAEDSIEIYSDKLHYTSSHKLTYINSWQKISFILVTAQDNEPATIFFPEIYLELFYWYNETTNGDKTTGFPELKCQVEYDRLNGSTVTKTFRISLREINYSPGLRGDKLYESSSVFATTIALD